MTTQEIANRLVELCRTGQFETAYNTLFAQDASSHEMAGLPNADVYGLENMHKKSAEWAAVTKEVHELRVSDPLVSDGYFALTMFIDLTKTDGTREAADELCLYEVKDGKITSERFYYRMG